MSALPPKADMFGVEIDVCFVPETDSGGSLGARLRQAECGPVGVMRAIGGSAPFRSQLRTPSNTEAAIRSSAFDTTPIRSKPTHEKQYDEDDQDDADDTDAAVTEAVAVAAEATTSAD